MNEHDKPIDTHVFSPKLLFDTGNYILTFIFISFYYFNSNL